MTGRAGITAVILAGSRAGAADPMASAAGVSHKALLPVAGVPMLARVADALRASPAVGRIAVMIEAPERTLAAFEAPAGLLLPPAWALLGAGLLGGTLAFLAGRGRG